jgi:hypothetical protein
LVDKRKAKMAKLIYRRCQLGVDLGNGNGGYQVIAQQLEQRNERKGLKIAISTKLPTSD